MIPSDLHLIRRLNVTSQSVSASARPLRRVLGLGFGLAMVFGGTVGAGILRLPGTLAASLGDTHAILVFWVLGGLYALLGAVSVSELAAAIPQAGGFYVYTRRAFGDGVGFLVGWSDWLNQTASIAYVSMTATAFLGTLWPPAVQYARSGAVLIIAGLTASQWAGLRIGSAITRVISVSIGLMMMILVVACFMAPAAPAGAALPRSAAQLPLFSIAMAGALVTAFRAVLVTYDGWYSPIYLAEESTDPGRTMPRAIVGGTLVLTMLYVLINAAVLRVLPLPVLAASQLPAADAARIVLPGGGAVLVTVISLLTVLSLVNATLLMMPRILLGIARDGLFTAKAVGVSAGGTPRLALGISSAAAVALILTGTFEQIVALASVLFLLTYVAVYAAVFVLRRREPDIHRPYRAFGFPFTTGIVLSGCLLFLIATLIEDPRSGVIAAVLLAVCACVYLWMARRRKRDVAPVEPSIEVGR
ncbi:MAG TPA: APC family permease [Steroidobacteraceae bacterium]|nr:APC family permease [Steroidobacteraceae bacterium]